jgi:hypothetical protein
MSPTPNLYAGRMFAGISADPTLSIGLMIAERLVTQRLPRMKSLGRWVIATEPVDPWKSWAKQMVEFLRAWAKTDESLRPHAENLYRVVTIDGKTPGAVAVQLSQAAELAGKCGTLVLSVGHGGAAVDPRAAGNNENGMFALGPGSSFMVGGRGAWLVGQPKPKDVAEISGIDQKVPCATSVFYADRPQSRPGIVIKSDLENDQANAKQGVFGAEERIRNFRHYQAVGRAFSQIGQIFLLTCRVGLAPGLLQRASKEFNTSIVAYKRKVVGQMVNGRAGVWLEGDNSGSGTNMPVGEVFLPMSLTDMVTVR